MTLRGVGVFRSMGCWNPGDLWFRDRLYLIAVAAPMFLRAQGRLTVQALGVSVGRCSDECGSAGNIYPVPPGAYSLLPYIYVAVYWQGFGWSMVWSARGQWTRWARGPVEKGVGAGHCRSRFSGAATGSSRLSAIQQNDLAFHRTRRQELDGLSRFKERTYG